MKKFMPGIFVAFMLSMSMAPLRAEYRALEEVGTVLEHGEGEAEAGLTAGGKTSMIQGKQQALLRQPAVVSPGRVEAGQLQITQLPPEQSVRGYVARVEGRGPQIGTTENIPGIKSEAGKISFTQAPGRGKLITPEVQEAEVVGTNISTGGVGPSVRAGEARPGEAQGVMGQGEPETMTGGEPETGATGETARVKKRTKP